jgi:hypothetical protein
MENVVVLGAPGGSSSTGNLATQIVSFNPPGQILLSQSPFTLTATASSGLPVSFTSTTNGVCTVSGSNLRAIAAGICSITATQAGNAIYGPATAVSRSLSIVSPSGGGTLSVSAAAITIAASLSARQATQSVTISFQTYTWGAPTYSIATTTNQGAGWLSASPATGTMTQTSSNGVPYTYTAVINISVNAAGMKAGVSYQGNVTFSAGGATTSTLVTAGLQLTR